MFCPNGTVIHRFLKNGALLSNTWINNSPEKCKMCGNIDWELDSASGFCSRYCAMEYEQFIPCRVCGNDCEGCDYEKWHFCTRRCMVNH